MTPSTTTSSRRNQPRVLHSDDEDVTSSTSTRHRIVYNPHKIDRSKRVAPGCEINLTNILSASKTRSRNNVNYKALDNGVKSSSKKSQKKQEEREEDKENVVNQSSLPQEKKDHDEESVHEEEEEQEAVTTTSSVPAQSVELIPSFSDANDEMDDSSVYLVGLSSHIKTLLSEKLGAVMPQTNLKKHRRTFGNQRLPLAIVEWGRIWSTTAKSTNSIKLFKCNTTELIFDSLEFTEMDLEEEEKNTFAFLKGTNDRVIIGSGTDTLLVVKLEDGKNCEDLPVYALKDSSPSEAFGPFKLSWILKNCESDGEDVDSQQQD
ncbi:hypothetical protein FDP41_012158 [Naegleria fowleri]|uniref:Uncharacterized protein n=1 Tax=Naegleria fowleri TaxID=5763 RepID=A0A6A5C381_NAEFO|nr:uncharacterized protein FDP41_012158 [Naegleria fowleri]KAF0981501.1 hypothetical protein FDP41_012158 [Naegleria fowleri]